jgi:two-component system KDP operon response regulator KdpE
MERTVLLIERDIGWLATLKLALECEGFSVITARDGKEGIRKAYQSRPQAILLDVATDKMDGWSTCRRLRQMCDTPILMLSVKAQGEEIVRGLARGADVHVTKTCGSGELSARIRALVRRCARDQNDLQRGYDDGHLTIDLWHETVLRHGEVVDLTPTESRLLMYLVSQQGRIVPHRELLTQVWGPEYVKEKRYLAVYIRYLRKKLEDNPAQPRYICTRWHMGYYFSAQHALRRRGRSNDVRLPQYSQLAAPAS